MRIELIYDKNVEWYVLVWDKPNYQVISIYQALKKGLLNLIRTNYHWHASQWYEVYEINEKPYIKILFFLCVDYKTRNIIPYRPEQLQPKKLRRVKYKYPYQVGDQ